jgi:GTPase
MDELNTVLDIHINDKLDEEKDDGNIEYKRELLNLNEDKINKRMTQMKYRVYEGSGEAFYFIGVMDNGTLLGLNETEYIESVRNLELIATRINCSVIKITESNKNNFYIGEFLIREKDNSYIDIKIGVAGNVDSGKSSTIGTLTKGILDDGRGKARLHVFNFKHEIDSGRTSSIAHHIMGYDINGNVVNSKNNTWADVASQSIKIISFYDLAGHEKYLRTTIYGLSSIFADYCLIMVGANMGINHMTREHIGICINLKIPFIIIVTKIDIVPDNVLEETMSKINNMIKNRVRRIPYIMKNMSDVISVIKNIKSDSIVPIIQISNVSNFNLDLLKSFLNFLPLRNEFNKFINGPTELIIDNTYSVVGHSTIVSCMIKSGIVRVNDNLLIGPYHDSTYKTVKVRTLHINYKDIKEASAGQYVCVSLKNVTRREIKKGMVLISENSNKIAVKQFTVQISVLHSPSTIKEGYQPFVHIEHVRQSVKMIEITKIETNKIIDNKVLDDDKHLRSGDKAIVKLEFIIKPEYIKPGMRLIFREGKVKATGIIKSIDN